MSIDRKKFMMLALSLSMGACGPKAASSTGPSNDGTNTMTDDSMSKEAPADECTNWDPSGECIGWASDAAPASECTDWDPSGECIGWGAAPSEECTDWDPSGECIGWGGAPAGEGY